MKLIEILKLIKDMEIRINSMNIGVKSYLGIVISFHTFTASDIYIGNIFLFEDVDIFEPGQKLVDKSPDLLIEYKVLDRKIRSEEGQASKKKNKRKIKFLKEMVERRAGINDQLVEYLSKVEFKKPQAELRFKEVDMEAIQEIKKHPIVQEIGKTDMSRASIRIVIG